MLVKRNKLYRREQSAKSESLVLKTTKYSFLKRSERHKLFPLFEIKRNFVLLIVTNGTLCSDSEAFVSKSAFVVPLCILSVFSENSLFSLSHNLKPKLKIMITEVGSQQGGLENIQAKS